MNYVITGAICLLVGLVGGGILTALYSNKVTNAVAAQFEAFKREVRAKL
jgi:hypothetical protein